MQHEVPPIASPITSAHGEVPVHRYFAEMLLWALLLSGVLLILSADTLSVNLVKVNTGPRSYMWDPDRANATAWLIRGGGFIYLASSVFWWLWRCKKQKAL